MQPLHLLPLTDQAFSELAKSEILRPVHLSPGQREQIETQARNVRQGIDEDWPSLLAYDQETSDKMVVVLSTEAPLIEIPGTPEGVVWLNVDATDPVDVAFADWDLETAAGRENIAELSYPVNHEVFTVMLRIDMPLGWPLSIELVKAHKQNDTSHSVIIGRAWHQDPSVAAEVELAQMLAIQKRDLFVGVDHLSSARKSSCEKTRQLAVPEEKELHYWSLEDLLDYHGTQAWALVSATDGKIIQYSNAIAAMWGMPLSMNEATGKTPADYAPALQLNGETSNHRMIEVVQEALEQGHHRAHYLHVNAQGQEILCDVWLQRIGHHDDLRVLGHIQSTTVIDNLLPNRI